MSSDIESQIDSCLAYAVLRDPNGWIGSSSPTYLQVLLEGARLRADYVHPDFPSWRIHGVLEDPAFYKQFVDATGHPMLSIRWATALELTHFSLPGGFAKLRHDALAWHRANGIVVREAFDRDSTPEPDADQFWSCFAKRPAMYLGTTSGWMLYCFLSGMQRGGDWLKLPNMPRLQDIFCGITSRSEKAYGSPFAAFRVNDAPSLLEWV